MIENGFRPDQKDLGVDVSMARAKALSAVATYMFARYPETRGTLPFGSTIAISQAVESGKDPNRAAERYMKTLATWFAEEAGLEVREKEQKD